MKRPGVVLGLVLLCLGIAASATVIPAVFTIDENNYLATVVPLREGGFGLPGTGALPPSHELYWFDPYPRTRPPSSPVDSNAPPLYALFALPFASAGWRGLVALNTLSWLIATALVFAITRGVARRAEAPWIAAGAFALGGFTLEYAQGVWPHLLSVALCTAGTWAAARSLRGAPAWVPLLGGLCLGAAAGVRYQNVVFAALTGLSVLLLSRRRLRDPALLAAGILLPLALCSGLNHLRLGSWNPVSKGQSYAALSGLPSTPAQLSPASVVTPVRVLWAKVIDFSTHPPIEGAALGPVPPGAEAHWGWEPDSFGAFLWHGAVKKALAQSAPWVLVALAGLVLAWRPRAPALEPEQDARVRQLRALSIPIAGMLGLFALAGFGRHDGLCFNQRYLLELVPLAAVAFALTTEGWLPGLRRALLPAALALGAGALTLCLEPGAPVRSLLLLKVPVLLGTAALLAWGLAARRGRTPAAAGALCVACLVWALVAHLGDDLPASRRLRAYNLEQQQLLAQALPQRAGLFAFGPQKDAAGPLLLGRDLVIADALVDGGADAPKLIEAMLRDRRPVFVDTARFPPQLLAGLLARRPVRVVVPGREPILSLGPVPPAGEPEDPPRRSPSQR